MIKVKINNIWIDYENVEWSGTDTQCSRTATVTVPWNPYDKGFDNVSIKLGDILQVYNSGTRLFLGTVTTREKTGEVGTATYTAMDFMHHLLRSNGTFKFKNKTPEAITKYVCSTLGIQTTKLESTKVNIKKVIFDNKKIYDIIITVYSKARAVTGAVYMPTMNGKRVSMIKKGTFSSVVLSQDSNITSTNHTDTLDNMVNRVAIYNDKQKKVGEISSKRNIEKYGVYQSIYKKEDGVNAKKKAASMLVGVTEEATLEAIGDVRAIAGKSIEIKNKATGLTGTYYITSDTHTFANGIHTMSLELSKVNQMEADSNTATKAKVELVNSAKAYYLQNSTVYHSSGSCAACKGKKTKKGTVKELKKIKITTGKNKGKRKYKACSKCWEV